MRNIPNPALAHNNIQCNFVNKYKISLYITSKLKYFMLFIVPHWFPVPTKQWNIFFSNASKRKNNYNTIQQKRGINQAFIQ